MLPSEELHDRFRAALLGLAVGDALGFPLRGVSPLALLRLTATTEDFATKPKGRFEKGQFTDDTQLALAVAESAIAEGRIDGRSVGAHISWLYQEGILLEAPKPLLEAASKLARGTPWMSAGASLEVQDASCLSRGLVAGLWNTSDVSRLAHDAGTLCIVTHKDPLCAAAATAFGRAVALGVSGQNLEAQPFCDELASAASHHHPALGEELKHLPRLLAWETDRALIQLRRVGVPLSQLQDTEGLPSHVVPVLLTALYAALKVPHDFRKALFHVLRGGGEADVAAALCGAILGAHLGTDAIPARLRRNVRYAEHLVNTADRLWDAKQKSLAQVSHGKARSS